VEHVGIAIGSCFSILTQKLGLQDVSANTFHNFSQLNKRRTGFAQTVYYKVKWMGISSN
jgi:hypothetical protein